MHYATKYVFESREKKGFSQHRRCSIHNDLFVPMNLHSIMRERFIHNKKVMQLATNILRQFECIYSSFF